MLNRRSTKRKRAKNLSEKKQDDLENPRTSSKISIMFIYTYIPRVGWRNLCQWVNLGQFRFSLISLKENDLTLRLPVWIASAHYLLK